MKLQQLLLGVAILFLSALPQAQAASVPLSFTHHGIIWKGDQLLNDRAHIEAKLLDVTNSAAPTDIVDEHFDLNVQDGYYAITIKNIDADKFMAAAGHIELQIRINGDLLEPNLTVNSVPYAIVSRMANHAFTADSASDLDCEGCINVQHLESKIQSVVNSADSTGAINRIANNAVGSAQISNNSVSKDDVGFNYAGSSSKGGAANVASYAVAIGSSSSTHPSIGKTDQPVYVNAEGKIVAATQYTAATVNKATNADLTITTDADNGDKLQIGSGTPQTITNAKHAASAKKLDIFKIRFHRDTAHGGDGRQWAKFAEAQVDKLAWGATSLTIDVFNSWYQPYAYSAYIGRLVISYNTSDTTSRINAIWSTPHTFSHTVPKVKAIVSADRKKFEFWVLNTALDTDLYLQPVASINQNRSAITISTDDSTNKTEEEFAQYVATFPAANVIDASLEKIPRAALGSNTLPNKAFGEFYAKTSDITMSKYAGVQQTVTHVGNGKYQILFNSNNAPTNNDFVMAQAEIPPEINSAEIAQCQVRTELETGSNPKIYINTYVLKADGTRNQADCVSDTKAAQIKFIVMESR